MSTVMEMSEEILGHVQDIRGAIEEKGGSPTTLSTFATEIANLPTGGGMPPIPSSWTTMANYSSIVAESDGWVYFKVCYYWGMGSKSYVTVGSRTYQVSFVNGSEVEDSGRVAYEGYAPMYAGETVSYTAEGSLNIFSFCKYAYI